MPTLTIDVSEELAAHIAALPPAGKTELTRRVHYAVAASLNKLRMESEDGEADEEGAAWWNSLTPQEREAERAIVLRSLAEGDAGRTKPAEEVYARLRAKYAEKRHAAS